MEIPSVSSRALISKQRHTARGRACSLLRYLAEDSPAVQTRVSSRGGHCEAPDGDHCTLLVLA